LCSVLGSCGGDFAYAIEEAGDGPLVEALHEGCVGVGVDLFEDSANVLSDGAVGAGLVAVHAESGFGAEGVTHLAEGEVARVARELPAAAAGTFGGDEAGLAQKGKLPPDDDGVSTDAGGDELGGQTLGGYGGQQGEDMYGGGETRVHI